MAVIIGINGAKNSGKSTTAEYIANFLDTAGYKVKVIMFAEPVKRIVCELTGCTMEQLELNEFKDSLLPKGFIDQKYDLVDMDGNTLQKLATEEDAIYDQDFWLGRHTPTEMRESEQPKTYRELLQYVGTEFGRDTFNNNIWINRAMSKISKSPTDAFIFSDVRFDNEAARISALGYVIHLTRKPHKDSHSSEQGINEKFIDFTIDNATTTKDNLVPLMEELDKVLGNILQ